MANVVSFNKLKKKTIDNSRINISDIRAGENRKYERVQAALDATSDYRAEQQRLAEEQRQRDKVARQRAVELAKNSASSSSASTVNAGDNRTTAVNPYTYQKPNANATQSYASNYAAAQPTYTPPTNVKKNISEKESLEYATTAVTPYLKDEVTKKLLDKYVELETQHENAKAHSGIRWMPHIDKLMFGNQIDEVKAQIKEQTGISDEELENLTSSYKYYADYYNNEKMKEEIDKLPLGVKLAASPLVLAEDITANATGLFSVKDSESTNPNLGRNYNSGAFSNRNIANAVRESVHNDIDESVENPILNTIANKAYDIPMMAAESIVTNFAGPAGLATFGTGAYAENLREAENRGLNERQAKAYAGVMGITEVATESIPFNNLSRLIRNGASKEAVKGAILPYFKEVGKQMLEEGGEEAINDVVDIIADGLINGDQSKLNNSINAYINEGYSEEDARAKAYGDQVLQIVDDFATGALSGGLSAGAAVGIHGIAETQAGREIAKNSELNKALVRDAQSADYISDERDDYNSEEEYQAALDARQTILNASEKAAKGERISGREARKVYSKTVEALASRNDNRTVPEEYRNKKIAQEEAIENIRWASDPYKLAMAIESVANMTDEVKEEIASTVDKLKSFNFTQEDIDNAITPQQAFKLGKEGQTVSEDQLKAIPEIYREQVMQANNHANNQQVIANNPTALMDKESSKAFVPEKVEARGDEVVVIDQDGNEHTDFYSPTLNAADAFADKYNTTVEQQALATELVINSPNARPAQVLTALEQIRRAASIGNKSWDAFSKSFIFDNDIINKDVAHRLYESIRSASEKADIQKESSATVKNEGKVSKGAEEALNKQSEALTELVKAYAKKTGIDIKAFTNNSDNRGVYTPSTGEIKLNTTHADNAFSVFTHEGIGEFLQRYNRKDFKAIQDDILEYLESEMGTNDFNALVDEYQRAYRAEAKKGSVDYNKSRREAANEMVNDTLFALFATEEGLKDFTNWVTDNKSATEQVSIFTRIKDFFDNLVQYIKDFIEAGSFNKAERAVLNMELKKAQDLRAQILAAMDEAIANRDAEVGQQGESEARLSVKPNEDLVMSITGKNITSEFVDILNRLDAGEKVALDEVNEIPEIASALIEAAKIPETINLPGRDGIRANSLKTLLRQNGFAKESSMVYNGDIKKDHKAFLVLGLPSSGKSSVITDRLLKENKAFLLDSDEAKQTIKEFRNGIGAGAVHQESKKINQELTRIVTANGLNVVMPIVGHETSKVRKIMKLLEVSGYTVDVHLVEVKPTTSLSRLLKRYISDNRFLNPKLVYDYGTKPSKVFEEVKGEANEYSKWSNEVKQGEKPILTDSSSSREARRNLEEGRPGRRQVARQDDSSENRRSIKVDSTGRELSQGQQEYFADSKVLDENGNLLVVYHGTEEEFYEFKPIEKGGKNGRAEGYGLYFAANQEITKAYGNRQLKGYLNITKPAYSWEKTIEPADLAKLIEATCKAEAERMLDDGYESIEEALKDTWVSNTVYTHDKSMKEAYLEAAKEYIKLNSNDMDIIITIMNDNGVQSYNDAYEFYAILRDTLGFDGYITKWTTADGAEENTVYVAFDSNQFKLVDNLNPTENADIRFSKQIDAEYMLAVEANDEEKMQQLVYQAAKEAGFDSPKLYHGTQNFGFTEFDLDKMDDKQTIFLTSNNNIAATYSGTTRNKTISEKFGDVESIPNDKLADALNSVIPDDGTDRHYEYFNQNDIKVLREKALNGIRDVFKSLDELLKTTEEEKALKALKRMREIQMLSSAEEILDKDSVNKDFSTMLFMATHHTETFKNTDAWNELEQSIRKAYALTHDVSKNEKEFIVDNYLDGYLFDVWTPKEARVDLKENIGKGNYSLYAKLGNSLVIDAKNQNWNNIRGWIHSYTDYLNLENTKIEIMDNMATLYTENGVVLFKKQIDNVSSLIKKDVQKDLLSLYKMSASFMNESLNTTRDIVKFAKTRGFDSVVFKNIKDNGGRNHKIDYDELADVYALFNPNNVKSADPVTLDDNGEVIPPSERFNDNTSDIRYSINIDEDRIYNYRGVEIVKNPTEAEYRAMRKEIKEQRPWLRDDEPLLRKTYDEEGNEYYWEALAGMHRTIEPAIRKHWGVRVAQNYEWWKDEDKYFWPNYYEERYSKVVMGEASPYADSLNESKVIQTLIGSMNNALAKADVFAMPNDELLRIERYLANKYKTNLEEGTIAANVSYAFAYMQRNKLDTNYESMMNYLLNIGDEIIKNSQLKDPDTEKLYNDAKKVLLGHKFKLTDADKAEISKAFGGSWNNAFGALQKAGIKLDNTKGFFIDEISSQLESELLKAASISTDLANKTPADQFLALLDTMTALEPTAYLWDGANDMDKALTVVADIVDLYYTAATEQMESNVAAKNAKGKEQIKKAIDKEKARLRGEFSKYKDEKSEEFNQIVAEKNRIIQQQQNELRAQTEQMKQWNTELSNQKKDQLLTNKQMQINAKLQAKQALQSYKEREERAKQIDNIRKTGIRLIKWLDNPTEKQHVPAFLQRPLGEFLAAIDFLPKNAKADSKNTLSWQQRMNDLRDVLIKIREAEIAGEDSPEAYFAQSIIAKDLLAMMDDFLGKETWDEFTMSYISTKREAKKVSLLDAKELATLNKIMSSLSAAINNMNKTYANEYFKDMDALARASYAELREMKQEKEKVNSFVRKLKGFYIGDKTPVYFFEELGKGAKSVFDALRKGWNRRTEHIREASEHFEEFKKKNNISNSEISKWSQHVNKFELSEGTIELTDTQIMSLYRIVNRKQGRPHVMLGGIKPADTKIKGKSTHKNKSVHINPADYNKIISVLSDEQIKVADELQRYMANECSTWGNRVAREMFGYEKFTEQDYFPLKTDAHSRAVTNATENNVNYNTIKNSSFTKNIVPNANNAVMLEDIFDVFASHVEQMANYDGFVMPIADAMRWYNYSEKIITAAEEGSRVDIVSNMQQAIEAVVGTAGSKYFRTFIKNINGIYEGKGGDIELLNTLASGYKAQAVMANARVVAQQPTAIARAAMLIEDKYILEALVPHIGESYAKKAQKNSALAYWKAQGYYETMIGQSLKAIITGDQSLKDKINEIGGWAAGKADDITWGVLYRATELKVSKEHPELKYDSEEYTAEVVKQFEDIIDHTQVIDTIFHKSEYMRSANPVARMATAFMAEPTLTINIAAHSLHEAGIEYAKGHKKAAAGIFSKLVRVLATNALLVSLAQSIFDALRDDEDEDRRKKLLKYWFGITDDMSARDVLLSNFVDNLNPLNWIPVAKEIMSYIQGYDASNMYVDAIYSAGDTISELVKIVQGKSTKTPYGQLYTAAKGLSQISGIPVSNVIREIRTLNNNLNDLWNGEDWLTTQNAVKKQEKKKATNEFHKAYESMDSATVKSAMQDIYNKAIDSGKEESEAWSAVRDALKTEFQAQIELHPEDKAAIINRFKMLLGNTKRSDGKGGFRKQTDKESQNNIDSWLGSAE